MRISRRYDRGVSSRYRGEYSHVYIPSLSGKYSRQRSAMIPVGCGFNSLSRIWRVGVSLKSSRPLFFIYSLAGAESKTSLAMFKSPTTTTLLCNTSTRFLTLSLTAASKAVLKSSLPSPAAAGQYTPIKTNPPKSRTRQRPSLSRRSASLRDRLG